VIIWCKNWGARHARFAFLANNNWQGRAADMTNLQPHARLSHKKAASFKRSIVRSSRAVHRPPHRTQMWLCNAVLRSASLGARRHSQRSLSMLLCSVLSGFQQSLFLISREGARPACGWGTKALISSEGTVPATTSPRWMLSGTVQGIFISLQAARYRARTLLKLIK